MADLNCRVGRTRAFQPRRGAPRRNGDGVRWTARPGSAASDPTRSPARPTRRSVPQPDPLSRRRTVDKMRPHIAQLSASVRQGFAGD